MFQKVLLIWLFFLLWLVGFWSGCGFGFVFLWGVAFGFFLVCWGFFKQQSRHYQDSAIFKLLSSYVAIFAQQVFLLWIDHISCFSSWRGTLRGKKKRRKLKIRAYNSSQNKKKKKKKALMFGDWILSYQTETQNSVCLPPCFPFLQFVMHHVTMHSLWASSTHW